MKIEKEPTKIVVQKRETLKSQNPKHQKPEAKKTVLKPEVKPQIPKSQTTSQESKSVSGEVKIKPDPNQKKISENENIKLKREQLFAKARQEQVYIRKKAIETRRKRRIFRITTIVTLVLLLLFAPIYPNREVVMNEHYYLKNDDIKIKHPLGEYFSPFQYMRYKSEVKHGSAYIKSSKVTYNLQDMKVDVNITEYKPLAKDSENNIYFYEDNEVIKKSDINLYAPIISGFDQKSLESLMKSMSSLDYDVITEIDTIEYIGTKDDPDLLKLGMEGDNTVYIDINQIKTKLPYYNQIKQIIDEKAGGKPGLIHLDIGDYYEPK